MAPPETTTGVPGNARPSSSAVRPGAGHQGPEAGIPAGRAPPARIGPPAPPAARRAAVPLQGERAGTGRAAGRSPAVLAGDSGHIAPPRHLDQDRAVGQPGARHAQRQARHPGGPGRLVPGELGVGARRPHLWRAAADGRAVGGDGGRPAGADQPGRLGGAGEPADQRPRAGPVRPQREDLPRVGIGGTRLGVQVVPVVPDDDQAEVADRGEHGGPGTGHHPYRPAGHGQPAPVALGGPEPGRETGVPARPEHAGQRAVDEAQVPGVRHHDERAPPGRPGRRCCNRDLLRPERPGQRRPDRARRPPLRERGEKRLPGRVTRPRPRRRPRSGPSGWPSPVPDGCRAGPGGFRPRRPASGFGTGVTRRDRQPEHVGQGAGAAVGDLPGERRDLRAQHRLGRNYPLQIGQPPRMLADGLPVPAGSRPSAGPRTAPLPGTRGPRPPPAAGHQVVEQPVEVGERDVDRDPGHRQMLGGRATPAGAGALSPGGAGAFGAGAVGARSVRAARGEAASSACRATLLSYQSRRSVAARADTSPRWSLA